MWLVLWKYSDGSDYGIVALYNSEAEAVSLYEKLVAHGDLGKEFRCEYSNISDKSY